MNDDGHYIDDPLMVVNAKPDFSGLGLQTRPARGIRKGAHRLLSRILEFMSKNGKSSLTPKAKGAAMRNREKMYYKALSFGIYNKPKSIADLCHDAWVAGYFYAKQESYFSKPKTA